MERLDVLATAIQSDDDIILSDWKNRVRELPSARGLDPLTLEDHFHALLDEISTTLLFCQDRGTIPTPVTPAEHSRQRFVVGFDVQQVITEYSLLRHALRDCAARHGISLEGGAGFVLHQIIDEAVAAAVLTFTRQQTARHDAQIREGMMDVIHDLKAPLSAIEMASHILDARLSPEAKKPVETTIQIIRRNCATLKTSLTRLLETTVRSMPELHLEDVQVRRLAAEVIERLLPLARKKDLPIVNEVPEEMRVTADAFLLKQAVQNLLSNAVTYTEQGQITVGASENDRRVTVWVRDTGEGISADRLPFVFARGEGDPTRPESTGIGLSIVKRVVDAHHGEVGVESHPGKGSTFTMSLPR